MHPSSMPAVMPKDFSSPGAERTSERSEVGGAHEWWRGSDGSDAPARAQGTMTGHCQLTPMSDNPLLAK